MARRTTVRLGVVLVPTVLLVAGVAYLVLTLPPTRSPQGPQIATSPLTFAPPVTSYSGDRIWYNFTSKVDQQNITWGMVRFQTEPGPLTRGTANWSLEVRNVASEVDASYTLVAGNWTSDSAAPVLSGETIVLETDSSLTMGAFGTSCPSLGSGAWGVEIL